MAPSRQVMWGSGLSPSCCLSYLVRRSWPGLLQCQASAHHSPPPLWRHRGGWERRISLFHIQLPERAKEGGSHQLTAHTGTLCIKSLVKIQDEEGEWARGWVRLGFYLRPQHEVLICSRGHYCDRLFTISDRLGLRRDLCYSLS